MAHVAYVSVGMTSTFNGTVELSRRLASAGHRVTLVSHEDLSQRGLPDWVEFVQLTSLGEIRERATRLSSPLGSWQCLRPSAWLEWWRARRSLWFDSLANDEVERVIADLEPDALLLDIETHYAIIATSRLDVPRVLVNWFLDVDFVRGVPPLSTTLQIDRHPSRAINAAIGRCRRENRKWRWRLRWSKEGIGRRLRAMRYDTVDPQALRALGRVKGVAIEQETDAHQWLRPWTYVRLPIMTLNLAELDFPHDFPANVRFVGPQVSDAATCVSSEVSDFVDRRSGPLVYCSLGTYFRQKTDLIERIVAVFAAREDWALVVGLGGRELELPLPANVLALPWAPQAYLLNEADCAILHGGISGINESLAANTPMLIFNGGEIDQPGNAARVAFHGLGVLGDAEHDDVDRISAHIQGLLDDSTIRGNVERFRAHVERHDAQDSAVQFVERQLQSPEQ
jgi:UDP:flavonoid glycosyltransferase YjiC (YdhE family)